MPPTFGPANAWLYNERDAMLGKLCNELRLQPEAEFVLEAQGEALALATLAREL